VGDDEVPAVSQDVQDVTLDVRPRTFGRQDVAARGEMPARDELVTHYAAELAGDEDFQSVPHGLTP